MFFFHFFLCVDSEVIILCVMLLFFFFKQKTAYEMRISDWSSDVCSSDLIELVIDFLEVGNPLQHACACILQPMCDGDHLGIRRAEIGRASCRERVCQYV